MVRDGFSVALGSEWRGLAGGRGVLVEVMVRVKEIGEEWCWCEVELMYILFTLN